MNLLTSDRQERRLKNKTERDCDEIEPHRSKNSAAHFDNRVCDCDQETNRCGNEKISIHREPSILDTPPPLAIPASECSKRDTRCSWELTVVSAAPVDLSAREITDSLNAHSLTASHINKYEIRIAKFGRMFAG
jgi:hypothetical protein